MPPSRSIRETWNRISTPKREDEQGVKQISNTNLLLLKGHDGAFGLCLYGVTQPSRSKHYLHMDLEFTHRKDMVIPGQGTRRLNGCLILLASPEINASVLGLILNQMFYSEPSGTFSTDILFEVLDDVEKILKRPKNPPTKEEVIGAWGELYVMLYLLRSTSDHQTQLSIIKGWEGETREKIDFRFARARQVMEIKSTLSEERHHHMHGLEQVVVPDGYLEGSLASICMVEQPGQSCAELVACINDVARGTDEEILRFREEFQRKIMIRGKECTDKRFFFEISEHGMKFFDFSCVPHPEATDDMVPLEWIAKLSNEKALLESDLSSRLRSIMTVESA